jgi:hypothetical protein
MEGRLLYVDPASLRLRNHNEIQATQSTRPTIISTSLLTLEPEARSTYGILICRTARSQRVWVRNREECTAKTTKSATRADVEDVASMRCGCRFSGPVLGARLGIVYAVEPF